MNKEINPRLKPCPFCGGPPYEESCDRLIIIGCEECDYHMSFPGLVGTKKTDIPMQLIAANGLSINQGVISLNIDANGIFWSLFLSKDKDDITVLNYEKN